MSEESFLIKCLAWHILIRRIEVSGDAESTAGWDTTDCVAPGGWVT